MSEKSILKYAAKISRLNDRISLLSAENSRLKSALHPGEAVCDCCERMSPRVSTEHTQDVGSTTQKVGKCRHIGDTRTEGGRTFCDQCGIEVL
jgi:hypothetical protein